MAKFVRIKLWQKLKKFPGSSSYELADRMKWTRASVRCALTRMRHDGCAVWEDGVWYATALAPVDGQGSSPSSVANLIANRVHWRERLAKANAVRLAMIASGEMRLSVPYTKRRRRAKIATAGAHALDRCFGLVSVPGKIATLATLAQNATKGRRGPSCVETPEDKEAA